MSDKNIYQRINEVQKAVKYVKKDAQITGGGSYKAVTHDQVVSVIRSEMVKHGIVSYPEVVADKVNDRLPNAKMYLYEGLYNIWFVNIDKPEDKLCVPLTAHAMDNGDKAPGKAVTYATKTAMLKVFNLETGENDESRNPSGDTYSESQKDTFDELIEAGKGVEYLEFIYTLTESARNDLYNSGEKGKKTELKKKATAIEKEGHKVIQSYVAIIRNGIAQNDDNAVIELIDELTDFEKQMTAKHLEANEIDWIKEHKQD